MDSLAPSAAEAHPRARPARAESALTLKALRELAALGEAGWTGTMACDVLAA
jgi:hypothetical protein